MGNENWSYILGICAVAGMCIVAVVAIIHRQKEPVAGLLMNRQFSALVGRSLFPDVVPALPEPEYVEKPQLSGQIDSRSLSVTDAVQVIDLNREYPYTPYTSIYALNYGPNTVKIAINEPVGWMNIRADEDRRINFGEQNIERIFCQCNTDETATVTLEAQY